MSSYGQDVYKDTVYFLMAFLVLASMLSLLQLMRGETGNIRICKEFCVFSNYTSARRNYDDTCECSMTQPDGTVLKHEYILDYDFLKEREK